MLLKIYYKNIKIFNIAEGRYSRDYNGNLYFDGKPIPSGLEF